MVIAEMRGSVLIGNKTPSQITFSFGTQKFMNYIHRFRRKQN